MIVNFIYELVPEAMWADYQELLMLFAVCIGVILFAFLWNILFGIARLVAGD